MESYLLSCPLLVIAWKLFKGLSPTLVALLAIFLNDRNARKRDLKNKIVDMKYNILTEVLNSLYNLEKDVIYIMERVVDLIELRKEIENLSGDDIDECIEKIKIIGNQSFEKLSYLMIQKNYFSNNKKMIEQIYNLNIINDKFDESLINFYHEVLKLLNKAVTKKLEYEDIEPCFSDISNQINACESIILGHIKKIVEE